jgi:hypothetical protein
LTLQIPSPAPVADHADRIDWVDLIIRKDRIEHDMTLKASEQNRNFAVGRKSGGVPQALRSLGGQLRLAISIYFKTACDLPLSAEIAR